MIPVPRRSWLPQRLASEGASLLQYYPAEVLCVSCTDCDRADYHRLVDLQDRFGPAASMPEVLVALTEDCSKLGRSPCVAWIERGAG
jgi:hypothetical protein